MISDSQARTMPYLQAVINEGLRWYSPATGMMAKQVPLAGDVWKGVPLPGGMQVSWSAWGIMRDKGFWGEDAEEFRPERWIEAGPKRLKEMEATAGLIFGYGK